MKQQGSISRHAWLKTGRWTLLLVGLLLGNLAQAQTYTFRSNNAEPSGGAQKICTGAWSLSGSTFTCNGVLALAAGDELVVRTDGNETLTNITIIAPAGIVLNNNRIGIAAGTISLESTYGDIDAVGSRNTFSASVIAQSGAITLSNAAIVDSVQTSSGAVTLDGVSGSVGGSVLAGGAATATNIEVTGDLSSKNGAVTLTNGGVGGDVLANGAIEATNTQVIGNLTSTNAAATLVGGSVGGNVLASGSITSTGTMVKWDLTSRNEAITLKEKGSVGGAVRANGAITSTDTAVTGDLTSENKAITLTRGSVGGAVWANGAVTSTDTPVTGDLTSENDAITLTRSNVGRNVLASGAITTTDNRIDGNLTSQHGALTLTTSHVGGDVWAEAAVTGTTISVIGNLHSKNAAIGLTDSCVFGNVSAGGAITLTRTTVGGDVHAGGALTTTNSCLSGTATAGGAKSGTPGCISSGQPAACLVATGGEIDHFEFSYAANALTCNPQPVTIRACLNADCSTRYTNPVSLNLTPNSGWTASAPASLSGSNALSFDGGSAVLQLRNTTAGQVALGVQASTPTADSQPSCSTADCRINFADSGFIFDVPTLLANKESTDFELLAVRKDDKSSACVPAFDSGTRTLQFWSDYSDPDTGTRALQVNGTPIAGSEPGSDIELTFGAGAQAIIRVHYADAGLMTLNARYAPTTGEEAGLVMRGDDTFVSKPYGLLLQTDTDDACKADINCPLYKDASSKVVRRAGDTFNLKIKAVAWQSDGQPLTAAALADNLVTPNFELSDIGLSSQVQAPVGGNNGTVGATDSYSHTLGSQTTVSRSISEVGVFKLTAKPVTNTYFGETVSGGTSGLVGRFIPASFMLKDPTLKPACSTGFTYAGLSNPENPLETPKKAGQVFTLSGSLSAVNRDGDVTRNYRDDFAKLTSENISYSDSAPISAGADSVGKIDYSGSTLDPLKLNDAGDVGGPGYFTYSAIKASFLFAKAHEPYRLATQIDVTDSDGVTGTVIDVVIDPLTDLPNSALLPDFRLGRLRIDNAHGSGLQPLSLPVSVESWRVNPAPAVGNSFQTEGLDTCTASTLGTPALVLNPLDTRPGQLLEKDINLSVELALATLPLLLNLKVAVLDPENHGSVAVGFPDLPSWLHYDWNGDGELENASGLATFGIYKGELPLIFRRELYR